MFREGREPPTSKRSASLPPISLVLQAIRPTGRSHGFVRNGGQQTRRLTLAIARRLKKMRCYKMAGAVCGGRPSAKREEGALA